MRIAIIQPDSPNMMYAFAFPSLQPLYLSSWLKKNGHHPTYIDLTGGKEMPQMEADIFIFYGFSNHWYQILDIKKKLKGVFAMIGPFPTYGDVGIKECQKEGVIPIVGESEYSVLRLIEDYPNCKEVYYQEKVIDPNEIIPDWEAIDTTKYGYSLEGKRCISMMTKRGECPFQCAFCCKHGNPKLRYRTAKHVLDEAKLLKEKYGYGSLMIYDDDVFLDKKRDYEIFKGLKELGMPYRCMTRVNLATDEDLQLLKDTGCGEVAIGTETVDPEIKKVIKKYTVPEQDTDFVRRCKKIGLHVKTYMIIGLPGESRESVEKAKKWLREEQPDNFDMSVFTPYPASDIYVNKEKYDIDWDEEELRKIWFEGKAQYDGCVVSTSHLTKEEIWDLRKEVVDEFKRGKGGATNYWGPLDEKKN